MRSQRFLLLVVFLAGIGTMGVEMVMSRLLAPYFGSSQPIWAAIIGLTLFYLALGYRIGGALADRRPDVQVLYQIITWAGFLTGFIPLVARPILRFAQQSLSQVAAGGFIGALLGVLLLFAAPVILMATVSPFATRLQLHRAEGGMEAAGRTVGTLSSISTIGSIIGTFLPVLFLIPAIGTEATLYLFSFFLLIIGVIGSRDMRYWLMVAIIAVVAMYTTMQHKNVRAADCYRCTMVEERESGYNYIQVAFQDTPNPSGELDMRVNLVLNEGQAIHSIYRLKYKETGDPLDLLTGGGPWDYFAVAPYLYPDRTADSVTSLAMLGSAAGTVPKQFLAVYGADTRIDAVEIDPVIIEMGRKHFDLESETDAAPNYRSHAQDARYWLATSDSTYDVIGMDAYHQPYIPFHLTTVEFFSEVKAHLNEQGVAVVNAGRTPNDDRLVNVLASTMLEVFPQVFIIDTTGNANSLIIGVNTPVGDGAAHFADNADQMEVHALKQVMYWAMYQGDQPVREFTAEQARFVPFTDDHAPVEQLIDSLIFGEAQRIIVE
jgi:predicted membrane-bound spermidine synthase